MNGLVHKESTIAEISRFYEYLILQVTLLFFNGRGGGIRTPDPLLPKQMRYQAALRPDDLYRLYRESEWVNAERGLEVRGIG